MPVAEIVTAAFGIAGKVAAKPAADAALRKELTVKALKKLHLDPHVPPQDFDTLYAYTLIEYGVGCSVSVPALFRDEYVIEAFRRSFEAGDWDRLRAEVANAVERGRETAEFGHLDHNFAETHVDGFVTAFQGLVDRSRAPHETRMERKLDELLERVSHTRDEEEIHRARTEPGRAELSPAARLMRDVSDWFVAVGYEIRRTWEADHDTVALLVDVPQRRPGRFDRTVMLCVEGELAPHHINLLDQLVTDEGAREGWGLAQMRVSNAARQRVEGSGDRLFCYTFDELVELEADFEPYIAWVEQEVRRRGIDTRYVPLSCQKDEIDPATQQPLDTSVYGWREGGLDHYVAGWLEDPAKKHLSLLGEFGMGKSWFALHLAGEMARGWQDARRKGLPRPRIPLLIPLRDYAKQTSVEALLSEFFFNKHKINLRSYDVFRVLNRMGRLLLVFDGFDEMAARADRNTMVDNFWELANAVEPGAKVLLSSRTEHFPDAQEARDLFSAKVAASASVVGKDGPMFEIVELVPFDDEQIERMLSHTSLTADQVRTVMTHEDVRDLMRRPVMSELVIDALPEIERGAQIDLARIYLYAIQRKMDRDIKMERTFTSRGDKLFFLCEVAWEMLSSNRLTLNYRDFPDRLRECFGPAVQRAKDLDYWAQDMRNQGMLVRNAEGDYGPSHKSLLEFLVAFKFAAELGLLDADFLRLIPGAGDPNGEYSTWSSYFAARGTDGALPVLGTFMAEPQANLGRGFGSLRRNEVVYRFLGAMVGQHPQCKERLLDIAVDTRDADDEDDLGSLAGNCLSLLVAAGESLENVSLAGVDLAGFAPSWLARQVSMTGADLDGANLRQAELENVDLAGANLANARLPLSILTDAHVLHGGLAHAGAVMAGANGEVSHWPDGRVDVEPLKFSVDMEREDGSLECDLLPWGDSAWLLRDRTGGRCIDVRTGQVGERVSPSKGALLRWEGRLTSADWDFTNGELRIADCATGELVATLPVPTVAEGILVGFVRWEGITMLQHEDDRLRYMLFEPAMPTMWRTLYESPLVEVANPTYIVSSSSLLMIQAGRAVVAVDFVASHAEMNAPGLAVPCPTEDRKRLYANGRGFAYSAGPGLAALATDDEILVWNLHSGAEELLWSIDPVPSGFSAMWNSEDGARLVVLTQMGELTVHDFGSGEILSRTMLSSRLQGTRFSRECGLGDVTLEAITRAGGVIVD
ncbi:NACHT domain-containing protein [Streptomyces bauhiniae]|uniref:NACHT domain-containing protein n=1 Tax=Streptomyces bauhiniae TaxID=2340725 RepID=A0A4Z1D478_9ACTN|nr:NACHT domain-containing protein [Streptomyces bauhiniae]TGN76413.1 NACHT domain-containing protein [Streptomyces bauhiniae]